MFLFNKAIPSCQKHYTFRRIRDLCYNDIEELNLNFNEVIYQEGQVSDHIYIIIKG